MSVRVTYRHPYAGWSACGTISSEENIVTQDYRWRRRFIEVVEEVFRELGFEPPPMTHDPDTPLVMDLELEGVTFEALHHPRQHVDHCLIEVNHGALGDEIAEGALMRLLSQNLAMARNFGDRYAGNVKTDAILYCYAVALEGMHGAELLAGMRAAAARAKAWRDDLPAAAPLPLGASLPSTLA
jgi:hypothetical protein